MTDGNSSCGKFGGQRTLGIRNIRWKPDLNLVTVRFLQPVQNVKQNTIGSI